MSSKLWVRLLALVVCLVVATWADPMVYHKQSVQRIQQLSEKCRRRVESGRGKLPSLNPLRICDRRISGISSEKSSGDGGFQMRISTERDLYTPEKEYEVKLAGDREFTLFQIILAEGGPPAGSSNPGAFRDEVGRFRLHSDAATKFSDVCPNSVSNAATTRKSMARVNWIAPPSGSGCVVISATVVVKPDDWYMDDGYLTKRLCPDMTENLDEQPEVLHQCQACDEAKYQIIFQSLWSELTHPHRNLPLCWESFFSGLIGASHSSSFHMWDYDGFASEALKRMAELGDSSRMELEIRRNASKIRSIIKSRPLERCRNKGESPSRLCRHRCFASFRVTKKHHLISFVSRVIPSPDWFVGVSNFELCQRNHSWIGERKMNLYLYDAGTSSGDSYKSRTRPTLPQSRIRLVSSSDPGGDGQSPFYDPFGARVKPFAMIHVKKLKLYKKSCEDELFKNEQRLLQDNEENLQELRITDRRLECSVSPWKTQPCLGTPFLSGEQIRNRSYVNPMNAKVAECQNILMEKIPCIPGCEGENICELADWGPWSVCDNPCGYGSRNRQRSFVYEDGNEYCDKSRLTDTQECYEYSDYCDHRDVESSSVENSDSMDPRCNTGDWSEWSPCSVSCGIGLKTRTRKYLNLHAEEVCSRPLTQQQRCNMGTSGCEAERARNIPLAVHKACLTQLTRGPCPSGAYRSGEQRWTYESSSRSCVPFNSTGCEGVLNNYVSRNDCEILCKNRLEESEFSR